MKSCIAKNKYFSQPGKKIFLLLIQRLWISFDLYTRKGLINHASACAYGFLLSAAPALLFIALFTSRALIASPELVEDLLKQIGNLFSSFNVHDLIDRFLSSSNTGLTGFISVIIIFWTTRLCSISVIRGLAIIFPGQRSILKDNVVTLGFGIFIMFIVFITLLGFRLALHLYIPPLFSFLLIKALYSIHVIILTILAILALTAYRFVPPKPPKMKNIIHGALVCMILFVSFAAGFSLLINPDRYNFLYGTLGRLFLFMVNVYFFFVFFFFGAQVIKVLENSDALLFSQFRKFHSKQALHGSLLYKLFSTLPLSLKKYTRVYKKDELVYARKNQGQEVYYILSGNAGVYIDKECSNRIAFIEEAEFFGQMEYFLSETRAASVKAETDLSVIILPPELFNTIMQIDPDTEKNNIIILSEQLKSARQQIKDLTQK